MEKTPNYQLNQWEAADRVQRADFNADNAKIDAAIAGKATIVIGSYIGDGQASRIIDLGFTPKAVLLMDGEGRAGAESAGIRYGGLAFPGPGHNVPYALTVVEGGFQVFYADQYYHSNVNKLEYRYLAIK